MQAQTCFRIDEETKKTHKFMKIKLDLGREVYHLEK